MEAFRGMPAPDRKRKRSAPEPDRPKSSSADEEKAGAAAETSNPSSSALTRPPPSEEEVEEFFTLLRRIHSAAKRSGNDNGKVRSTIFEREVPLTLPLLNGGPSAGKRDTVEGTDNGAMIIDLNAVPDEAEESSGG